MYQLSWANQGLWNLESSELRPQKTRIDKNDLAVVLALMWEEHCVECAWPECYHNCTIYSPRADGACARFAYGIFPNEAFEGLFNYGADIRFRKWAKIEANLSTAVPVPMSIINNERLLASAVHLLDTPAISNLQADGPSLFDDFILECYSSESESYNLILECFQDENYFRTTSFRWTFNIKPGDNFFRIPFTNFKIQSFTGYIKIFPEDTEKEKRIIFTWLDFVKYKRAKNELKARLLEKKVKCVVWDLDNTIWEGILSEGDEVSFSSDTLAIIKEFDQKGIIQSICSKNDFNIAISQLKKLQIHEYFLYPQINWGKKSENILYIAEQLNIDLDNFAFIDDSPFERQEVKHKFPQIRVYSEAEINLLATYPEFNIELSHTSSNRRQSYIQEANRKLQIANFSGEYEDFLIQCEMILEIFLLKETADITRSWELVQRSNQLNLSSKKYSLDEFLVLIRKKNCIPLVLKCHDKYGDYGIIGFSLISFEGEFPVMNDLALSCRIAQKRIEHMYIVALCEFLQKKRQSFLDVNLVETRKNGPLRKVFDDLQFKVIAKEKESRLLRIATTESIHLMSTATIIWDHNIIYD